MARHPLRSVVAAAEATRVREIKAEITRLRRESFGLEREIQRKGAQWLETRLTEGPIGGTREETIQHLGSRSHCSLCGRRFTRMMYRVCYTPPLKGWVGSVCAQCHWVCYRTDRLKDYMYGPTEKKRIEWK